MPFSGGSLPSLDGLLSPSLSGAFLISLLTELSSGGSLPILNRFLDSLNGLSSGGPLPSLDGLLSPSLSGFFLIFTVFGGKAVPGGVVKSTLTPDLQSFSGFGTGQFLIS